MNLPTDWEISHALWVTRKRLKLNQQQMADKLEISRPYLSLIERNETNIGLAIFRRILPLVEEVIEEMRDGQRD